MPFHLRRYVFAALVVVVLATSIGWLCFNWAAVLGLEERTLTISSPISQEIRTDVTPNRLFSMPSTPGDWHWRRTKGQSIALFAKKEVSVVCDIAERTISIGRRGYVADATEVRILTSTQSRTFLGRKLGGQTVVTISANHAFLDALAFSRGRFGIEVAGLESIYPPSWSEVSRVLEDCRGPFT